VEDLVDFERRHSPAIEVELSVQEAVLEKLPEEVYKGVLLVVREALTNGRRHSSARADRLGGHRGGSPPPGLGRRRGVRSAPEHGKRRVGAMRERAALLSGKLEVFSEPAEGTKVRLRVPRPL